MDNTNKNGLKSKTNFNQLKVKGFRRLLDINIPLKPLTVMIGANGVGKTSILDLVDLLAISANGGLNKQINDLSGINALLTIDKTKELILGLNMPIDGQEPLEYKIELVPKGNSYAIATEQLIQQRHQSTRPFIYIDSSYENITYYDIDERIFAHPPRALPQTRP